MMRKKGEAMKMMVKQGEAMKMMMQGFPEDFVGPGGALALDSKCILK